MKDDWTPERKEKHSVEVSNRMKKIFSKKIKCVHCNKDFDQLNYNRWHGDNCKLNNEKNNV